MYYVFAISSIERNYVYVGMTDNLERRIAQHNAGKEKTTKPYVPFVMLCSEACVERKVARLREKYLKSGSGKRKRPVAHSIPP